MTRKIKMIIVSSLCTLVIIVIGILIMPYIKKINSNVIWQDNKVSGNEQILLNFIDNNLTNKDGSIKTNYKDVDSDGDITKGKAVLSESEGMLLLYYLDRNDKEKFDNVLSYIKEKMILENGLVSWRVTEEKREGTSATIDDLRIIKALLLASERWNKISYRNTAFKISKGIKKELLDNNVLVDYNDGKSKANTTTICYLDIETLSLLAHFFM
ncbi:MAG: glycosyl hydrolase family 8 [Clostridiaceae bacterium]|nr:glycosyl hydrolase family 8 [Clostridiaceae bacterium]